MNSPQPIDVWQKKLGGSGHTQIREPKNDATPPSDQWREARPKVTRVIPLSQGRTNGIISRRPVFHGNAERPA
jgi:hypothetical protein